MKKCMKDMIQVKSFMELLISRTITIKKSIIILPLLLFTVNIVNAQETIITGTVVDELGDPLPSASIIVKGRTNIGTATDLDGYYELNIPQDVDTLIFSYIGYQTQEVVISNRSEINVVMNPVAIEGEGFVVTGYQVQRKVDLTGSIAVADVEDIVTDPNNNVMRSLQGRVPGLTITTDGSPANNATIRIRGESTLGNNSPLFVIDGVPSKTDAFKQLSPNEIESIQILKDASSASIYGSRASNGVVIISTKSGNKGLQINVKSSVSTQMYLNPPEVLNTEERGRVLWQAAINDGINPNFIPIYDYDWNGDMQNAVLNEVLEPEWINENLGIRSSDTDWFNEISRTGIISSNNVTLSTGDERGGVLASLTYNDNTGIVKGTDYNRIAGRLNSNYNFFDGDVELGLNFQASKTEENPMPFGQGGNPLNLAVRVQPILPVYTEDGKYAGPSGGGFSDRDNPVRLINHNNWDRLHSNNVLANLYANVKLVNNLTYRTNFGVDYINRYNRFVQRRFQTGFLSRDINNLFTEQEHNLSYNWSNTLNYEVDLQKHSFNVVGGIEAFKNTFTLFNAYSEEFTLDENEYFVHEAATGVRNNDGFETGFQLLSYFGRVNYNYSNKYLASATLRYDGSSRFGEENKYGIFPALSFGWRINNEDFFNVPQITELKLRGGWGNVGNQEIGNAASAALFEARYSGTFYNGTAYDISGVDTGTLPSGFVATQTANPNLKWEETTEYNIGLDFGFLNQSFQGSFDYFFRETKDILIQPAFIAVIGEGGNQWINGATVENWGFEGAISYLGSIGKDFSYFVRANVGAYRDQITRLPESVIDSYPGNVEKNILGESQHAIFGYVTDGIFQNQDEVDDHANQTGAGIGRIRYKDLNNDGVVNALDQKYLGVQYPDFEYGISTNLNYKRFSIDIFLQGVQGTEIFYSNNDSWKVRTDFVGIWAGENYGRRTLDAWTPDNSDSDIPALSLSNNNSEDPESRPSDYFVEDGSYLKLRNVQLNYDLPQALLNRIQSTDFSIYFRAENVLQITSRDFTGRDPETPDATYPRPLILTVGLNLSF